MSLPDRSHEPGETDYEEIAWAQAMFAGGFRPGDIAINTFSYHMVPFALHMVDNSLHQIRMHHRSQRALETRNNRFTF